MEETGKNLEKLETAGKIVFGVLLIVMPTVSVCLGYSKWWLIGYGAVAMGSVQALAACRLSFEHIAGLLIADAVLAIAVIVSLFASSVWIPIVQIAVSAMAGGSMYNLLEEQNKAKNGGDTALQEEDDCEGKYTERCRKNDDFYEMKKEHLKSLFIGSARHENPKEMKEIIAELKEHGCFDEVIAEVRHKAADSPEASFTFGYYLFFRSFEENDLRLCKWGVERIAKAARQDYMPAMKFVARCFNNYRYGNASAAEKELLKGMIDIASEYCSPEYCAQKCVSLL